MLYMAGFTPTFSALLIRISRPPQSQNTKRKDGKRTREHKSQVEKWRIEWTNASDSIRRQSMNHTHPLVLVPLDFLYVLSSGCIPAFSLSFVLSGFNVVVSKRPRLPAGQGRKYNIFSALVLAGPRRSWSCHLVACNGLSFRPPDVKVSIPEFDPGLLWLSLQLSALLSFCPGPLPASPSLTDVAARAGQPFSFGSHFGPHTGRGTTGRNETAASRDTVWALAFCTRDGDLGYGSIERS